MEQHPLDVRTARPDDLDTIVALTKASRRQLAAWSPVYFNPREGADENHANYLRFIVNSEDHQTRVLTDDDRVVGFFTEVPQPTHLWIDDLCISSDHMWKRAVPAIAERSEPNWVTCVSVTDTTRLDALSEAGLGELSAYYSLSIKPTGSAEPSPVPIPDYQPTAPAHTFGGQPFSPYLPGALVVANDLGYAVGSPSATPPIYDPGGPTCVIDQIHGHDVVALLDAAIRLSADRGDAHIIVVCDASNSDLAQRLHHAGFTKTVSLQGTPSQA